jgi:hypothetical protein
MKIYKNTCLIQVVYTYVYIYIYIYTTYEGALSESNKGLLRSDSVDIDVCVEEKSDDTGIIESLINNVSSRKASSVSILQSECLESSQGQIEHKMDQIVLDNVMEKKANKISGNDIRYLYIYEYVCIYIYIYIHIYI